MAPASGAVGAGPSIGYCACLRRELAGEPDVGNLHLRFDEGRVGLATCAALSPTLPSLMNRPCSMGMVRMLEKIGSTPKVAKEPLLKGLAARVVFCSSPITLRT